MQKKQTDEQLVSLAQKGDEQATEALIVRYGAFVRSRARRFFLVGGETEDLIQEGSMGLFLAIRNYSGEKSGKSFKNFAYLCVLNKIIDAVKKANAKKNALFNNSIPADLAVGQVSKELSPDDILIAIEQEEEIRGIMRDVLSKFELDIFTMYIDGFSYLEICKKTGKSMKSVDNAVQRSRKKLRVALSK